MNKYRRLILIMVALMIVIIICGTGWQLLHGSRNNAVVVTVNGEPITFREYKNSFNECKPAILSNFVSRGAVNGANFWSTEFDGEKPIDALEQMALKKAASIKLTQLLAKKYGLITDITYKGFLKQLADENKSRAEKVQKGQIIYGPKRYEEEVYFDIMFADLRTKVKDTYKKSLHLSDDDLLKVYKEKWQVNGQTFEQDKEAIIDSLASENLDALVEDSYKSASIKIIQKFYNSIGIN